MLTEEEQIESAKYLARELPPRLFEEERFLFPETYGANRVRLLVRDPEWLFAYWDVDPASIAALRSDQGERAGALSRLSLRVFDPQGGGTDLILLPEAAKGSYVRTHAGHRTYRAELGFTLPSGEFRRVAVSNTVTTPRGKAARERASRRMSYKHLRTMSPSVAALWAGGPARGAEAVRRSDSAPSGPTTLVDAGSDAGGIGIPISRTSPYGGASDALGPARPGVGASPGASDSFPPGGASDVHRR